jgi:hypothetical protein
MSASLTNLCPSNFLRSNYQTHSLHKIQITVTKFSYYFFFKCLQKRIDCMYREKKNKAEKNQLMSWFRLQTQS